jgi:hypothetical protein
MLHAAKQSSRTKPLWLKILVSILALLLLIVIAAEIVFTTDLPRNLVINLIEKQFGLRISAKSLSTGIFGHTTLQDVTATLPLADKAFLEIPELKINHTWLPGIIFGSFNVHDISIDHPRLQVVQEPGGSWNLLEVAQLLGRTASGNNSQQSKPGDIPVLPALTVTDASLTVIDNQRRSTTLQNLQVTGAPDGPLVWQYQASIPGQLDLSGKLAPGGPWAHEIEISIQNAAPWLSPWVASWPTDARVQAHWTGRVDSGNLQARLDIEHANYNAVSLNGPLAITAGGSTATFQPAGIIVSPDPSHDFDTRIERGNIVFSSTGIQGDNLSLEFAQGRASAEAKYTFADGSASIHAIWRGLSFPASVTQSGDLQLGYSAPLGHPQFTATLSDYGVTHQGNWNAEIGLSGSGTSLSTLSLYIQAPTLSFQENSGKSIDLTGTTASIGGTPDGIVLRDLRAGHSHPIAAEGNYSTRTHSGNLSIKGYGWPIPGESESKLNFQINVNADPQSVQLTQFDFDCGRLAASITGAYVYSLPRPVTVHAYLAENPAFDPAGVQPRPFRGLLQSTIDLNGTVAPIDLFLTGWARGKNVYIGQRPIGDVKMDLTGEFHDGVCHISSKDVLLLGGNWNIAGYWPLRNGFFHLDNLSVDHLSLPLAADNPNITGTLDAKWTVDAYELSPDGIVALGSVNIHNLDIPSPKNADYLRFDEIQIPTARFEYGNIEIDPITVTHKTGTAKLALYSTLEHPAQMTIPIEIKNWPITLTPSPATSGEDGGSSATPENTGAEGSSVVFSTTGKLDLNLAAPSATGHLDVDATTTWQSQPLAQIQAALDLQDRTANATSIQIKTLNGIATGTATYDLDKPYSTLVNLNWKNFDLASLKPLSANLAKLSGKTDGTLQIHPATTPRPLGPLTINVQAHSDGIHFTKFAIGDLQAFAFLGPDRFVLDDSPLRLSQIAVAGGTVRFWGRVARHTDDIYQSLVQLQLQNLDLDTVLPAGSKVAKAPGLLSGEVTLLGGLTNSGLAMGQGVLTLDQSDLAGTGPIAFVYNLMHVGHDAKKPTGTGRIEFNIQNENAYITAMRYFDKGTEVRLSGEIANLPALPHSPLSLIAVGSVRPLASIHIPGIGDFDEVIGAVQHDAITVSVNGTLDQPVSKAIPFHDITQTMKDLLFGDTKSQ